MEVQYFNNAIKFLRQFIEIEVVNNIPDEYEVWDHIALHEGRIICNPACNLGYLLHEAGHVATCPSEFRFCLSGEISTCVTEFLDLLSESDQEFYNFDDRWLNFTESAAIGWSYLVGLELQISPKIILETTFDNNLF